MKTNLAPENYMNIGLAAVNIPEASKAYLADAVSKGELANGEYIERLEQALSKKVGTKHAIVTSSGTMADVVALAAVKEKYHADRVICPALTFVAQPNAARMVGLGVEFVDVTEDWTMNWDEANKWRGLGNQVIFYPSDCMGRIASYGVRTGFPMVEDACEAFGSTYMGRQAGTFGEMGTFSFYVSHTITTGEGGAIVTNDDWLAQMCRTLRSHGRASETEARDKFRFPYLGYNAKMTNTTAAIGLGVVENIDAYIQRRRQNFLHLNELLDCRFKEFPGEEIIPHGYPLEFRGESLRDDAMRVLLGKGIECRKFFSSLPTMEGAYSYQNKMKGSYPNAERIAQTFLYIPCHQNLSADDVSYLAQTVKGLYGLE